MSQTLAAVAVAPGRTELRELPLPPPSSDAGLLAVQATGVCGSDWGYYQNLPQSRGPLVLGHESVGHVAALDPVGVASTRRPSPSLTRTRVLRSLASCTALAVDCACPWADTRRL